MQEQPEQQQEQPEQEQDHDLLIRIDERLKTLKDGDDGDIPEIKRHLEFLNGTMVQHGERITTVETKVKMIILTGSGAVGGGGVITLLGKLLGWF
jgi:hypothetical protein